MNDKILLSFLKQNYYSITENNVIGATTDQTLRTLDTISDETLYVRKYGTDYLITQVTDIEDPVDANMTFTVKADDGTTLGSRTGGGAFSAGSTVTAQGCYLEIAASGGNVTVLASITIDTNVDAGGLAFTCAAETVSDGDTLTLYLSDTGSTYYDEDYKYGGGRHTAAKDNIRKPYPSIHDGYAGCGANDGAQVLDSETYELNSYLNPYIDMDSTPTIIQAALGQTPIQTTGIGQRITMGHSILTAVYNNTNTIFVNENGDDADAGTWQEPKLTIKAGVTAAVAGGQAYICYGGSGATVSGGQFTEDGEIALSSKSLVCESGYMPEIYTSANTAVDYAIIETTNTCNIQGWKIVDTAGLFSAGIHQLYTAGGSVPLTVYDCEISCPSGEGIYIDMDDAATSGGNFAIYNTRIYNSDTAIYFYSTKFANQTVSVTISNCYFYNLDNYGFRYNGSVNRGIANWIKNCIFYNIDTNAIFFEQSANQLTPTSFSINHNTFWDCDHGIYIDGVNYGAHFNIIASNIFHTGVTYGIFTDYALTASYNNFYNCGTNYNANVTSNLSSFTDPKFINIASEPYNFGVYPDGGAWGDQGSGYTIGFESYILLQSTASNIVNGIKFDGNNQFHYGIVTSDLSSIKWCDAYNCQANGILSDDSNILNCKVYDNGGGINTIASLGTLQENLIYKNTGYGLYIDTNDNGWTIDHNVFYNNEYGIYNIAVNHTIKNTIFYNITYDIYSTQAISASYCDIYGAVSSIVDVSSSTNKFSNPLFVDTENDDYNIKTVESGYTVNSPCKDAGESDIGAYDVTRTFLYNFWKKFQLLHEPFLCDIDLIGKGNRRFENAIGVKSLYSKSHKRSFTMAWRKNSATDSRTGTGQQRKVLEYVSTLYPTRENGLSRTDAIIRVHFKPQSYVDSGTNATIDASGLTDSNKAWELNELKGWHVGIQFASGTATGTITASTNKLQVSPSPSWTNDEWIGYYFFYDGDYYYITDNDADELTFGNPDSTLVDASNIDWSIDKYFKIDSNTDTVLTLADPDSELIDGTYDYYINFMESVISKSNFAYSQNIYNFTKEFSKSGYKLDFEEYDE